MQIWDLLCPCDLRAMPLSEGREHCGCLWPGFATVGCQAFCSWCSVSAVFLLLL